MPGPLLRVARGCERVPCKKVDLSVHGTRPSQAETPSGSVSHAKDSARGRWDTLPLWEGTRNK
jgi:hypothetical protein